MPQEYKEPPKSRRTSPPPITNEMLDSVLACYVGDPNAFAAYTSELPLLFSGRRRDLINAYNQIMGDLGEATFEAAVQQVRQKLGDDREKVEKLESLADSILAVTEREKPYVLSHVGAWVKERIEEQAAGRYHEARERTKQDQSEEAWQELDAARRQLFEAAARPEVKVNGAKRPLDFYKYKEPADTTLLGNRWVNRRDINLFVGPAGVGKSSAAVQAQVCWAIGKQAFGIEPSKPLRILVVQAENNDGDLHEMFKGVMDGLRLKAEEHQLCNQNLVYHRHNGLSGDDFLEKILSQLLREGAFDLVWLDPLNAFLGGEPSNVEAVQKFIRQGLQRLIDRFDVGCIITHHTPKLSNMDPEKVAKWRPIEFAYVACGSSELTNAPRGILVMWPMEEPGAFRFIGAKHGNRLAWKDENGAPTLFQHFVQSKNEGEIMWREPSEDDLLRMGIQEAKKRKGRKQKFPDTLLAKPLFDEQPPTTCADLLSRLAARGCEISKTGLWQRVEGWMAEGLLLDLGNARFEMSDKGTQVLSTGHQAGKPIGPEVER